MCGFAAGGGSKADIGAPRDDHTTFGALRFRCHELRPPRLGMALEDQPR
jgi:hypothetical protein